MKKLLTIILILFLVLNLVVYALGKISTLVFWLVILIGFGASFLLKKLK